MCSRLLTCAAFSVLFAATAAAQECGVLDQELLGADQRDSYREAAAIGGNVIAVWTSSLHVYVRADDSAPWVFDANLEGQGGSISPNIAIDADTIVARGYVDNWVVWVFRREGPGTWALEGPLEPTEPEFEFRDGLAIHGDLVFVEQETMYSDVAVFRREPDGIWVFDSIIPIVDMVSNTFGRSIDLDEDLLFVGDPDNDRALIYRRLGEGLWDHEQTIYTIPGTSGFGADVDADSDSVVVGSYSDSILAFRRPPEGAYVFEDRIVPDTFQGNIHFGRKLGLSGGVVFTSAPDENTEVAPGSGALYAYVRGSDGQWTLGRRFLAPDGDVAHFLGVDAGLSGTTGVGVTEDLNSDFDGAVYVIDVSACAVCAIDCDKDGAFDIFDFLCFQGQITMGDLAADCDENGHLDIFDFLCFQALVSEGCDP